MSWPSVQESVKALDLAQYQNWANSQPDRAKGRIDFEELAVENPNVKLVIIRACATSYIDADWEYNWKEAGSAGWNRAAYINNDPTWAVNGRQGEMWKRALDDKNHQLIVYDCESKFGRSPLAITKDIREGLDFLRANYPNATVIIYTAEWFWKTNVIHDWEADEEVWAAQYPYMIQRDNGTWRVVYSFKEMDPFLPIHNSFTPRVVTGFKRENMIGWQITSKGIIKPIAQANLLPRTDLSYFLKARIEEIFDGVIPVPPNPTDPVPLKLTFPKGTVDVTIEEI